LKRVKRLLEEGTPKVFVSFLPGQELLNLQDVAAEDIALQMVRQLVADLHTEGFNSASTRFGQAFAEFGDLLNTDVALKDIKISGWLELGIALKEVPGERSKLRELLGKRLPTLYQLINQEILVRAKEWLKTRGYQDILLIVDDLDKIPQRQAAGRTVTNHEEVFLEQASSLRFLACDTLFTVPIELAYSRKGQELRSIYGGDLQTLPVIPVTGRNGKPNDKALGVLRRIVEDRARKAGYSLDQVFPSVTSLDRLCAVSGGHLRYLFLLLRGSMDRSDDLPLKDEVIERTMRGQANTIALPLRSRDWKVLRDVHQTKNSSDDDVFFGLLRDLFIFSYTDEREEVWYDWNPLLGLRPEGASE
jgi:hypothetical protein